MVGQILNQFFSSIGLIEEWSVDGIQSDQGDSARLLLIKDEITECARSALCCRGPCIARDDFFKGSNPLRLAVFQDREIVFAQAMDMVARFISDYRGHLDKDRLRLEPECAFVVGMMRVR